MSDWRTTCSLLQLISCHLKTAPPHLKNLPSSTPTPPHHLHLHFPANLSYLGGDVDSGQGLEAEEMHIFGNNDLGRPLLGFSFFSAIFR